MSEEKAVIIVNLLLPQGDPAARGSQTVSCEVESTVDCRGRNGWFAAQEFVIWRSAIQPMVELAVWSSRRGDSAPVLLQLPFQVAQAVGNALLLASRSGPTPAVGQDPSARDRE